MAFTTIDDPTAHFQNLSWTGDGSSTRALTNTGNANLQPDFVWLKNRTDAENHTLADTSRGVTNRLMSNNTNGQDNSGLVSVQSDGFTVQQSNNGNTNAKQYVAYQWKANGGTTASNSSGTITSTVQANTAAGFSIISYTGNGSDGATIGHGLNATPEVFFPKCTNTSTNWEMYYFPKGGTRQYGYLNLTNAFATWSHNAPSSTIISLSGSGDSNGNGRPMIGYAFHSVKGFSKIGTFPGNGLTNGPFVYTGFKPALLFIKRSAGGTGTWLIWNNASDPRNTASQALKANTNDAQNVGYWNIDLLSNGFKPKATDAELNGSGNDLFYMAFAESPFVSSAGVPTTAR